MAPPDICPNCGAEVPRNARACPECGSCDKTGWSEEARASGLGLPAEDFDYEEFVKREFGREGPKPRRLPVFWWLAALAVLAAIIAFCIL
jgi:hypothetical protein